VAVAYSESVGALRPSQILGAPSWLESEHYDIEAKAANADDMSSFNKTRLLLRTLLEDRFKLRVQREQRQMSIYALIRTRNDGTLGPHFKQSTTDCSENQRGAVFPVVRSVASRPTRSRWTS
jgi:uncharacterized protein (TIGR03435 family)